MFLQPQRSLPVLVAHASPVCVETKELMTSLGKLAKFTANS